MSAELKSCPFCGGSASMGVTIRGGGFKKLALFVQHDASCIIRDYDEITCCFIYFDTESDAGKSALMMLERGFAKDWNRRDGA